MFLTVLFPKRNKTSVHSLHDPGAPAGCFAGGENPKASLLSKG